MKPVPVVGTRVPLVWPIVLASDYSYNTFNEVWLCTHLNSIKNYQRRIEGPEITRYTLVGATAPPTRS